MAKTIITKLSAEIIADFTSCFEKKEEERSYLYHKITSTINNTTSDIFQKKMCSCKIMNKEDGTITQKPVTLDEINFYKTEIPNNESWQTKDIAGTLEPYEYVVGSTLYQKISDFCKLNYLINKIYNESVISHIKNSDESKNKKQKEDIVKITDIMSNDCMENYTYSIFSMSILEKIKQNEKVLLDKEFAEINKPVDVTPTNKPQR